MITDSLTQTQASSYLDHCSNNRSLTTFSKRTATIYQLTRVEVLATKSKSRIRVSFPTFRPQHGHSLSVGLFNVSPVNTVLTSTPFDLQCHLLRLLLHLLHRTEPQELETNRGNCCTSFMYLLDKLHELKWSYSWNVATCLREMHIAVP